MQRKRNPDSSALKITLLTAGVMTILGGAAMAPALPSIRDHFSAVENVDYLSRFVLTLPAFFIAVTAPGAGYLVDRIGRMRVLLISLGLVGAAGTAAFLLSSLTHILASRALVGIGVAGVMTSATTLIADYYSGAERGKFLGLQTGLMGLGGTVSLLVTGVLADIQWNAPFLIHLAALGVLPFAAAFLYEPRNENRCPDDHPAVGEPGACAGESEFRENPVSAPVDVPYRLLAFIYLTIIFIQVSFYIVPLYLPFYLGDLTGASATQSGLAISFMSLSFALSSIFLGKPLARRDRITIMIGAFAALAFGYALISFGAATIGLYLGLVISGVALGAMVPSLYVWLANGTPVEIRGRALGGFSTATFLGQFLSPVLSQPLIEAYDIGLTILIAGVASMAVVPLLFAGRRGLRGLSAAA